MIDKKNALIRIRKFLSRNSIRFIFILYAVIGCFCFDDYGCGPDEGMERQTSLVNYRYVVEKLNLPVSPESKKWMEWLPNLHEYRDRYYGTAVHIPVVLIESLTNFTMEADAFYSMRHFYTFLNFYLSMICFYQLLKRRFANRCLAICGVLIMMLTPRFFAESFYNNKDVLFLAWYIFSIFFILRWLRRFSFRDAVFAGVILAFTCNTRFNGIALIPIAGLFWLIQMIKNPNARGHIFLSFVVLMFSAGICFYIITPNFWETPLKTLSETFLFNKHHPNHGSDGNLFFGNLVDSTTIRSFIPVWMAITIPTGYILFSGFGFFSWFVGVMKDKGKTLFSEKGTADLFMVLSAGFPVFVIIAMRVIIYDGWRHCYFAYAAIVYFAVYGLAHLLKMENAPFHFNVKNVILAGTLSVSLCVNLVWIILNHPYEYDYFSLPARENPQLFSGDYWGIASRDMFRFIAKDISKQLRPVNVCISYSQSGSINEGLLPRNIRDLITVGYEVEEADYIVFSRDNKRSDSETFPGFEKVFTVRVDKDEIAAVYKRQTPDL